MLDSELMYPEQLAQILLLLLTPPALLMALWHVSYLILRRHSLLTAFGSLLIHMLLGTSIAICVIMEAPHWQGPFAATDLRWLGVQITLWPFGLLCYAISALVAIGWLSLASKARASRID